LVLINPNHFFISPIYIKMSAPNISAMEYRRRYLASLNLQNKVNAYNLEANSLFKQTGQPSAPADTRTITEKTADSETTKRTALQELLTITDRGNATQIVQSLGDDELRFVIEQIGASVLSMGGSTPLVSSNFCM